MTMAIKRPRPARSVSEINPEFNNINSLVAATNKNDRFKLLEDENVPPGDLDNTIHPIFHCFHLDGPRKQTLQLASQFLAYDSVLTFFVPLLYGCELTDSRTGKTYLSDPLASASDAKRSEYITGVRRALCCLAHCVEFRFEKPEKRVWARTMINSVKPKFVRGCCKVFQRKVCVRIEVADMFDNFYDDDGGYATSTRCGKFRHDFLFATTIVHEIVHAVGVMRRGHLLEPCCRLDDPDVEWGYSWENYMFGGIINPQDRTKFGTHLLMRKVWADSEQADAAGGKEYCDVPMTYIARWFRKSTWDAIKEFGPLAIPLPISRFKIQASTRFNRWIVLTDCKDTREDIRDLQKEWNRFARREEAEGRARTTSHKITWGLRTKEQLQQSNVPIPLRVPNRSMHVSCCAYTSPVLDLNKCVSDAKNIPQVSQQEVLAVCRSSPRRESDKSRKRQADSHHESDRPSKVLKP